MAITVGVDFSPASGLALRKGYELAQRRGEQLVVVFALEGLAEHDGWRMLYETPEEVERHVRLECGAKLREFVHGQLGPDAEAEEVVAIGAPAETVLSVAVERGSDLIVLGATHEPTWKAAVFGTTASRLMRESPVPVLSVYDEHAHQRWKTIVVALDTTSANAQVLAAAAALANDIDARLVIIHALTVPQLVDTYGPPDLLTTESLPRFLEQRRSYFQDLVQRVDLSDLVDEIAVRADTPGHAIERALDDFDADVICLGTHGRSGVERLFLGSTAERVLRASPVSVLVVRPVEGIEAS